MLSIPARHLVSLAFALFLQSQAGARIPSPHPHTIPPIFKISLADRQALFTASVPVRLPGQLPPATSSDPLYLQPQPGAGDGYRIVLTHDDQPCEGQSVCSFGTFIGSRTAIAPDDPDAPVETIQLSRGITARYTPSVCYASCTEAIITWPQDHFFYSVGIKAGSRQDLVQAADLAIEAPPISSSNYSNSKANTSK